MSYNHKNINCNLNNNLAHLLPVLDIMPTVQEQLSAKGPVVALESTIISHGMPYPENLKTARELENIVRANGAVPATCGIIKGRLKVGLEPEDLEFLATSQDILKATSRDLPLISAMGLSGATTVSATLRLASLAGISVFATGGIGGVHRGFDETMDISADLMELGRLRVALISAGAKAILDLPRTLEYLETLGVPVIGMNTLDFPAFYNRQSGLKLEYKAENPEQAARIMLHKWKMGQNGGILFANPIPEIYEMDRELVENAIEKALRSAKDKGIIGKKVTPFLLDYLYKATQGKTLEANIELVKYNAEIAAKIGVEYARLTA